jgi:hypothetical protein
LLDVRPHRQDGDAADGTAGPPDWWVVSDFGADVRGGPLAPDHVLGIGAASLTLAQSVPRNPVGRSLDLGTGSGVQALHLSRHSGHVTATDLSVRALRCAATTAALSGCRWDLREGSLLDPVAGEAFDLVVGNPPFVVSDGRGGYDYRDSGLAGDGVSEHLFRAVPAVLAEGGSAHLLANWIIPSDGEWAERVSGWLAGSGCDAWVRQREVADPGEYVALWLRDAGLSPSAPEWAARYDAWLDWFATAGVVAVGMGYVSLWRRDTDHPVLVVEDVPQQIEQPSGAYLPDWIARQRLLAGTEDPGLLAAAFRTADGVVRERSDLLAGPGDGWQTVTWRLRQSYGLRWDVAADEAICGLVAACDGTAPLLVAVSVLAAAVGRPVSEVADAVVPVVRDLVGRGFLEPVSDQHPTSAVRP